MSTPENSDSAVELSVTVWERTWRSALVPDFFARINADLGRGFDDTKVVINNVSDIGEVRARCEALLSDGVITGFTEVESALGSALAKVGLSRRNLEPLPFYTDHFLVKVCDAGPRWLVHWDTDVVLTDPGDWVTPTISYLQSHPRVVVGMPGWPDRWSMDAERLFSDGPLDLGYGFTDHTFLVDRRRLAAPIYRKLCPASWWYPTSHLTAIFEQRVDAWMRRERLLRATYTPVRYSHDETMQTPPGGSFRQRVRRKVQSTVYQGLQDLPGFNPVLQRRPRRGSS